MAASQTSGPEFDARLKAYLAAGRAALIAGAALGATTIVDSQVVNLTASSFSPAPSKHALNDPIAASSGRQSYTHDNLLLQPFIFGTRHPGIRISVSQNNYTTTASNIRRVAKGSVALNGGAEPGHGISFRSAGGNHIAQMTQGYQVKAAGWVGDGTLLATYDRGPTNRPFPIGENSRGSFHLFQNGYVGFRVEKSAGKYYYGWLRVQVGKDSNGRPVSVELVADGSGVYGAYDATLGAGITVGETAAVPEPASAAAGLALFALGAVGVKEFRRRRKAVTERETAKV